jgi:hypothetical protein
MTRSKRTAQALEAGTAKPTRHSIPTLPPPRVPLLLPNAPEWQYNLLPMSATREPLRVEFEMWLNSEPTPEAPETLTLYWGDSEVGSKTWTTEVLPADLFIMAPVERMGHGEHTLSYRVELGSSNEATSSKLTVTVDTRPPELPAESYITFSSEVVLAGVTDSYLKANGDQLKGTTCDYKDGAAGDLLIWYWDEMVGEPNEVGRKILSTEEAGKALEISYPGAALRLAQDGLRVAYFSIQDRAQTEMQMGRDFYLDSKVTPAPRILPPPTLQEAVGGSLGSTLRPIEAIGGGTLLVKEETVIEPGEQIKVFWGLPGSPGAFETTTPIEPGKRAYRIPADKVAAQSGETLPLYYEVSQSDGTVLESARHTLKVEMVSNMPTPDCDKVNGGVLSIKQLANGDAIVRAQAWPFVAIDQEVTLQLYGRDRVTGENLRKTIGTTNVTSTSGAVQIGTFTQAHLGLFKTYEHLEILAYATFKDSNKSQPFAVLRPLLVE